MPSTSATFDLHPHPATPCPAVQRITVDVTRDEQRLHLRYRLEGDLAALTIPAPSTHERRDELWRHTCCEAFVRIDGGDGYVELNFSPSGEWAMYRFDDYRKGMAPLPASGPQIDVATQTGELALEAAVELEPLGVASAGALRLALTAVVETADGRIAYWALAHAPGKPDFHHEAGFVARVAPGASAGTL
jgi:hypothetical protein